MNNLKKVGLTALGTVLVSTAAGAADLSVTGGAAITWVGEDNSNMGNGFTMGDSLTFTATVDNDVGDSVWAVTMSQEIDNGSLDDVAIKINTGDFGTVTFSKSGTEGVITDWDDLTPTAAEEAWGVAVSGTQDGATNGVATGNSWHWDYSLATIEGVALKASYFPSDTTTAVDSSIEYGVKYTGIEGLEIALGMGENNNTSTKIDNTIASIKYTMGDLSVGAQANESDSAGAGADEDFTAWGISYLFADDIQVSYNISETDYETSTKENQEGTGISFSYTTGSLTWTGAYSEVDNVAGTAASDNSGYELNLAFTF